MTVAELIAELLKMPQDKKILLLGTDDGDDNPYFVHYSEEDNQVYVD